MNKSKFNIINIIGLIGYIVIILTLTTTLWQLRDVDKANPIIDTVNLEGLSTSSKIKYISMALKQDNTTKTIQNNLRYINQVLEYKKEVKTINPVVLIKTKKANCVGYSFLFCIIAKQQNIDCNVIGTKNNHAIVKVRLETGQTQYLEPQNPNYNESKLITMLYTPEYEISCEGTYCQIKKI